MARFKNGWRPIEVEEHPHVDIANRDVAGAQEADRDGNVELWGISGLAQLNAGVLGELCHELHRRSGHSLASLRIGVGQGIAVVHA